MVYAEDDESLKMAIKDMIVKFGKSVSLTTTYNLQWLNIT